MISFLFILISFIGRVTGWSVLPVLFLCSVFFVRTFEVKKMSWLIAFGVFSDVLVGSRFGLSSLFFIALYFQITAYKEKVDSVTALSMFLIGLLTAVETALVWDFKMNLWQYAFAGGLAVLSWMALTTFEKRGGSGVYLRQ